ncbi:DUF72 domain-containing protein [uncultured Sphingomonas sp.]|uniref:DUF72 domain-containing protein n=1 Tax=uncultured Sphingomonas sp. TaxID=158754 RepID=UPI0025FBFB1A|nr:DUF72 domain-containing protein [uncultured Sphingomonas sp.]
MRPVIGTAGWAIPAADRPYFPAEGSALQRYAMRLTGVEINSSFYRPHRRTTWQRWAESVPDGFGFAAKMPKTISHTQRLADVDALLDQFLEEVGGLTDKLAVLLLQLPPSFAFDAELFSAFCAALSTRSAVPLACEPRHASWFTAEADALLAGLNVARVAADPARVPEAATPGGWRGLSYWRLHGSPVMYRSAYGEPRLREVAASLSADSASDKSIWCIFDNTASSAAMGDALLLSRLLEDAA